MITPDFPVPSLRALVMDLARAAGERRARLASAESCTGGLVATLCTSVAGSSDWFDCAFVTYSIDAKERLLGVPSNLISAHGAVSEPVARAMALGALIRSNATLSVSITGIAGPAGGEVDRPVGTVWLGWAVREGGDPVIAQTSAFEFEGERLAIREQAARVALEGFLQLLAG